MLDVVAVAGYDGATPGAILPTATRRKPGLGWIAVAGAIALAIAWCVVAPWLTALAPEHAASVAPVELLGAVAVGIIGWRAARPAATLGPRGAVGLGGIVAMSGAIVSAVAAPILLRSLGAAE